MGLFGWPLEIGSHRIGLQQIEMENCRHQEIGNGHPKTQRRQSLSENSKGVKIQRCNGGSKALQRILSRSIRNSEFSTKFQIKYIKNQSLASGHKDRGFGGVDSANNTLLRGWVQNTESPKSEEQGSKSFSFDMDRKEASLLLQSIHDENQCIPTPKADRKAVLARQKTCLLQFLKSKRCCDVLKNLKKALPDSRRLQKQDRQLKTKQRGHKGDVDSLRNKLKIMKKALKTTRALLDQQKGSNQRHSRPTHSDQNSFLRTDFGGLNSIPSSRITIDSCQQSMYTSRPVNRFSVPTELTSYLGGLQQTDNFTYRTQVKPCPLGQVQVHHMVQPIFHHVYQPIQYPKAPLPMHKQGITTRTKVHPVLVPRVPNNLPKQLHSSFSTVYLQQPHFGRKASSFVRL